MLIEIFNWLEIWSVFEFDDQHVRSDLLGENQLVFLREKSEWCNQ